MDRLAAVAGCLGVGSLEDVAKVQFGFAGYCKVVLNSTVGASLTPCRTFKLFQTRVLAQNLQQISLSPLGGGGVFSLDWLMALTSSWLISSSCWLEVSYDLQISMHSFSVSLETCRSFLRAWSSLTPMTILSLIRLFSNTPKLHVLANVCSAVTQASRDLFGSWTLLLNRYLSYISFVSLMQ